MAKAKQPRDLVVPPVVEDPDQQLAASAGAAVVEFLKGLAGFFTTAQGLEMSALGTLAKARELKAPTCGIEDEYIQSFVRGATSDRKAVEEHWTITSTVHQFHRRLTARRDKAVKALEEAGSIATRLHNTYVDAERRRAAAAQERLRIEAETKARQDRERELAAAEEAALKREAASKDLSEREQLFVDLVASGTAPSQAAYRAGYKDTTRGLKMLEQPKIAKAIQAKREAIAIRQQAAAKAEAPLEVDEVPEIKPDVTTKGNRTTWSAELLDEQALIAAVIAGKHGIPWDILQVRPAKLNEYARSLETRINLWPGVRAKKTTTVI